MKFIPVNQAEKTDRRKTLGQSANSMFSPDLLCEHTCRAWLVRELAKAGKMKCPSCGDVISMDNLAKYALREKAPTKLPCSTCGKWFRLWAGTPFRGRRVSACEIFMLGLLNENNNSLRTMVKISRRRKESVAGWLKIMEGIWHE